MLFVEGYTIDRIIRLDEEESKATLELASGKICFLPKQGAQTAALLDIARSMHTFQAGLALRIVDGILVDAAGPYCATVVGISPQGERPVKVDLWGKSGVTYFDGPETEDQYYPMIARALATQRELVFFLGGVICAVAELSHAEMGVLKELLVAKCDSSIFGDLLTIGS